MDVLTKLEKKILKKSEWTTEDLLNIIDKLKPKCKITFFHIGGYELLRDGTKEETCDSLKEVQNLLEENELEYDTSLTDPIKLAKSVESQWEERYDDGGGSAWIEY